MSRSTCSARLKISNISSPAKTSTLPCVRGLLLKSKSSHLFRRAPSRTAFKLKKLMKTSSASPAACLRLTPFRICEPIARLRLLRLISHRRTVLLPTFACLRSTFHETLVLRFRLSIQRSPFSLELSLRTLRALSLSQPRERKKSHALTPLLVFSHGARVL